MTKTTKLYSDIYANSNIIAGEEYKNLICTIAQVASDMVKQTLGPYGATTVVDDGSGFTYPSKDGWTCLSRLNFMDPTYNTIYEMLKRVSFNSVTTVGDGTTTAMVAANKFLERLNNVEIPKAMESGGFRQADFIYTMDSIVSTLIESLSENENAISIDKSGSYGDIYKIAKVATNGNEDFASIIQAIYQSTNNPNIQVKIDMNPDTTYEIQKGYQFGSNVLNYPAYVNSSAGEIELVNKPRYIVVFNHSVSFQHHEKIIQAINEVVREENAELLILAPGFDEMIARWMDDTVQSMMRQNMVPNIMLVQVSTTLSIHRLALGDIAVMSNCNVFDEARVRNFNILHHNENVKNEEDKIDDSILGEASTFTTTKAIVDACMGRVNSITFNKNNGFLQDYDTVANPIYMKAVMKDAEDEYLEAHEKAIKVVGGTLEKDYLFKQMRYIKLQGSTGVIHVGALNELQRRCDKDSIDDAVLACKSAFEYGYVRGMNIELIRILTKKLKAIDTSLNTWPDLTNINKYHHLVCSTLLYAFKETAYEVMRNKHGDNNEAREVKIKDTDTTFHTKHLTNEEIIDEMVESEECYDYDLQTEGMSGREDWSIINSVATDIEILKSVASILSTVMTSSQFISMTRRFDEKRHGEVMSDHRVAEERKYATAKAEAFFDVMKNSNIDITGILKG